MKKIPSHKNMLPESRKCGAHMILWGIGYLPFTNQSLREEEEGKRELKAVTLTLLVHLQYIDIKIIYAFCIRIY